MEARRLTSVVVAAWSIAAMSGCHSLTKDKQPSDPFTPKPAATVAAPNPTLPAADATVAQTSATASLPGTSISQAAYSAAAETDTGASLGDGEDEDPSWWERTTKTFSAKEIKRQYKAATGHAPDEEVARQAYNEGDALFREGKFDEAAEKFAITVDRWPNLSLLEEDGLYMLGESYYFADRYPKASKAFNNLLHRYENTRHLDRVTVRMFAMGRYWEQEGHYHDFLVPNFTDKTRPWFDTKGTGIKSFETIRLTDPTGPLADDAVMAQANSFFVDNRYEDAAFQYEILRKDYPQSEFQKEAHLLGLQSYMSAYQGPQYDKTPLKQAEKLADTTLRNYGHDLPEEKERLLQAKESIRAQTAERDYDLGEYYRRLGYNRAARRHYAIVLRDFPGTKFADLSKQRMQETENLRPEPPDYFPWLTKMLARERPQ